MKELNKDDALRQSIMGIKANYKLGGTEQFHGLTLKALNSLIENEFVDLDERQNPEAPSIREFWELLKAHPCEPVTLHGYITSPERDDYRISIEGLKGESLNKDFIRDLLVLYEKYPCGIRDIFYKYQYSWYD